MAWRCKRLCATEYRNKNIWLMNLKLLTPWSRLKCILHSHFVLKTALKMTRIVNRYYQAVKVMTYESYLSWFKSNTAGSFKQKAQTCPHYVMKNHAASKSTKITDRFFQKKQCRSNSIIMNIIMTTTTQSPCSTFPSDNEQCFLSLRFK